MAANKMAHESPFQSALNNEFIWWKLRLPWQFSTRHTAHIKLHNCPTNANCVKHGFSTNIQTEGGHGTVARSQQMAVK